MEEAGSGIKAREGWREEGERKRMNPHIYCDSVGSVYIPCTTCQCISVGTHGHVVRVS